jgi:hypothetical protein
MITKIKNSSCDYRRGYVASSDFSDNIKMINSRQKRTLTELIYQRVQDESERDSWLSQINDMSFDDASETIFEFLRSK